MFAQKERRYVSGMYRECGVDGRQRGVHGRIDWAVPQAAGEVGAKSSVQNINLKEEAWAK
jgi:hypothetical protein